MRGAKLRRLAAAAIGLVLALVVFAPAALADELRLDVGSLSNRYEQLESIGQEVDGTENVVVTTRIGVLTAANRALDGATVSFSGEVVGDVMNADEGRKWVNLLATDGSCIGVLVDDEMAKRISNKGDYSTTGTTLQVRGIYSIDCKEHQGELDVHAIDVRVLDPGGDIEHYVSEDDVSFAMKLCAAGFLLLMAYFVLRWYFARREAREQED